MTIEIRACRDARELDELFVVSEKSFGEASTEGDRTRYGRILEQERSFGAWDRNAVVGTAANLSFSLTVPGTRLPAAGLTIVGVLPPYRRRGILTRLMQATMQDSLTRGESLSILWASEGGIYGRFGYGIATRQLRLRATGEGVAWRHPPAPEARFRLLSPEEAERALPPVYDQMHRATPGTFARSGEWWRSSRLADPPEQREGAGPMFCVLLEMDGEAQGYALYRIQQEWDRAYPEGKVRVAEAIALTPSATLELWRYLFAMDLTNKVESGWLPYDHPLFLLVADPRRLMLGAVDAIWLRILDIRKALSSRSYASRGRVTFELEDVLHPQNAGTWELDARGERPAVVEGRGNADVRLDVRELASLYLGGFSGAELARAGLVEELQPGGLERLDDLFHTPIAPFCPEIF